MPSLDYARERKLAAKELGVNVGALDKEVAKHRKQNGTDEEADKGQGRAVTWPERPPWPETVDGADLLDTMAEAIGRHVVMPEHSRDVAALWAVHTYLLDALHIRPRLGIRSPEKRCGKTTLLDVLEKLTWRPLLNGNMTLSTVFRVVEAYRPCLLVDEADSFLPGNDELRGVINSGYRRGGSAIRNVPVGDNYEVRRFSTYAAVAIALIGKLPGTIHDRALFIDLKRRLPSERIEPFRTDRTGHLDVLARQAAKWAEDNAAAIGAADPEMPDGVFNREADNWRGLLAIADRAGGEWPERARNAALRCREAGDNDGRVAELLTDIKAVFIERATDRLSSATLVEALVGIEGHPWAEYGRTGKPLSQNRLARLLAPVGVNPGTIRVGEQTPKGYELDKFEDAFSRYLPPEGGLQPQHRHKPYVARGSEEFTTATEDPDVAVVNSLKALQGNGCGGVAVWKGGKVGK